MMKSNKARNNRFSIIVDPKVEDGKLRNSIVLHYNNWDDFGYKTTYNMFVFDSYAEVIWSGVVQIYCNKMDEEDNSTEIRHYMPKTVDQLDDSFCSLGTDLDYYRSLKRHLPKDYLNILERLNDLAYSPKRLMRFEKYKGVRKSLLRASSSVKALYEAYALLEESSEEKNSLSFSYFATVPYCENRATISFVFEKDSSLPGRINALVGKNGTGKTSILKGLAEDLSGFRQEEVDEGVFLGGKRPSFDKIMSVSYSAFDPFNKMKNEQSLWSYVYCGIQKENGSLLNEMEIRQTFSESLEIIQQKQRLKQWEEILKELVVDDNPDFFSQVGKYEKGMVRWSSGQSVLVSSITELIAKIDRESIVLFDEPELHLHPNAISSIMRVLNRILKEFNSYAIVATHSPIILQEIPSRNISVLERIDNQLFVRRPEIECFGENLSLITRDIFNVTSKESFYQSYFQKLKKQRKTRKEIEKMFENKLGLNALIYLDVLFAEENRT